MWWEQISVYIDLTYQKSLDEMVDLGTDSLDAPKTPHIKDDIIWTLSPKTKQRIMRGQWGKEMGKRNRADISLQGLLKLNVKNIFLATRNVFHIRAQFFNIRKQEDNEISDEF